MELSRGPTACVTCGWRCTASVSYAIGRGIITVRVKIEIIEFAEVVVLWSNCIHVVILVTSFATCRCRA